MAKIKIDRSKLGGRKPLPAGSEVQFKVEGFAPKLSSKGNSVNLNPVCRIFGTGNPELDGQRFFENLNSGADWVMLDFTHSLGLEMEGVDKSELPGDFDPIINTDPSKAKYTGPIVGRTGRVLLGETDNGKGGRKTAPQRYLCIVPGCTEQHTENLLS